MQDVLDPSLTLATEPDDFSWYDQQYEMGSTYSQHGLCHFLKNCDNACQDMRSIQTEALMQEMLVSSTNAMALGKLLALESTNKHDTSYGGLHTKETIRDISTRFDHSLDLEQLTISFAYWFYIFVEKTFILAVNFFPFPFPNKGHAMFKHKTCGSIRHILTICVVAIHSFSFNSMFRAY